MCAIAINIIMNGSFPRKDHSDQKVADFLLKEASLKESSQRE